LSKFKRRAGEQSIIYSNEGWAATEFLRKILSQKALGCFCQACRQVYNEQFWLHSEYASKKFL
jgi:hypothetical protein